MIFEVELALKVSLTDSMIWCRSLMNCWQWRGFSRRRVGRPHAGRQIQPRLGNRFHVGLVKHFHFVAENKGRYQTLQV